MRPGIKKLVLLLAFIAGVFTCLVREGVFEQKTKLPQIGEIKQQQWLG
ncbi:hypothetical protein [Aminobacterium colombiense]|uniref:Uncharacterized protein n=1 Tax=Aminobacterium colombiense (strain DSM 12261 / ALA-1) TaxID=572547 RepID=D5EFC6_AMICL|nr:hypothetical protein [Aminobacterium colombiense]ADE57258.1 hypothetical protein Amico_1135 [Aminobacterium colombiense DSM 12261]